MATNVSGHGNVKVVDSDAFFKAELKKAGNKLVIVDFHATWCGPCKTIAPAFTDLSVKHVDIVFLKVDVDNNNEIAQRYNVTAMPTFLFFKLEQVIESMKGADIKQLKSLIDKHTN